MKKNIEKIYRILKYYRSDDKDPSVRITPNKIKQWIGQFDKPYQKIILDEVVLIFSQRYCSKAKAKRIIERQLIKMSTAFKFKNVRTFLAHCQFLDLQESGSSQKEMLLLADQVLKKKFNYSLARCGRKSKQYSIYLDDVFCTGNRVLQKIEAWYKEKFTVRRTNLSAVQMGKTTVVLCFIFAHYHTYVNRAKQLRYPLGTTSSENFRLFTEFLVDTAKHHSPNYHLIFPAPLLKNKIINAYRENVERQVNAHIDGRYNQKNQRYFRDVGLPKIETLFSSSFGRNIVEKQFLLKGIEILKGANTRKENIRALGFTLPSDRSFGFGALCFTWRNVANNTPLVFWYSQSEGFTPLFQKR